MMSLWQGVRLAIGVWALAAAGPAVAQENLDLGKSPAQLFASDCAICHKTTQGLSKGGGVFGGLQSFLREHYTASKESAAAIAAYVEATDKGPAPAKRATAAKRKSKPKGEAKTDEKKPEKNKSENKPDTDKSSEAKSDEAKSSDTKSGDSKPAEVKSSKSKPAEAKVGEPNASDAKPDNEPDAKSGSKVKSD
jgi:hypothetical protein